MRFLEWLKGEPPQKKRAPRHTLPGMVACYWDGTGTSVHQVKDIGPSGAFVYAKESWGVGAIVVFTLHATGECQDAGGPDSISLPCRIARHGPDGVGIRFMLHVEKDRKALNRFLRSAIARSQAPNRSDQEKGQALVEFALMVPVVFLLIVNVVNFGGFLYDMITVANAARAGVQYAALGVSSVQTPPEATLGQVQTLVQHETSSLANSSATNPSVTVCVNNNGTSTVLSSNPASSCTTAPLDPEVATGTTRFTTVAVDVAYTYSPFIPLFDFPGLGIHATIPTTTIHRQAVMRVLN